MKYRQPRKFIEAVDTDTDVTHAIEMSLDEMHMYVTVIARNILKTEITVEKTFTNNYSGLEELQKFRESSTTKQQVAQYMKLDHLLN